MHFYFHTAKPDINLSPKILTIERDKEKTISCAVNKYYPDEIVVQWEKNSKHTADKSVPAEDICTGSSVKNEYGTFNVTSKLKLQPSLQDDGNIYSCIVKHKSFSLYPVHSVTLTVTGIVLVTFSPSLYSEWLQFSFHQKGPDTFLLEPVA